MLIGLAINSAFSGFAVAQNAETGAAEKIKIKVAKLGTVGKLNKVEFKDKSTIKGYITEIKDDYFVLVNKKNGTSTNISYAQVQNVGRTFTAAQKIGLSAAAGLLAFGIIGTIVSLRGLK